MSWLLALWFLVFAQDPLGRILYNREAGWQVDQHCMPYALETRLRLLEQGYAVRAQVVSYFWVSPFSGPGAHCVVLWTDKAGIEWMMDNTLDRPRDVTWLPELPLKLLYNSPTFVRVVDEHVESFSLDEL
jgi:hypothetical protein